jgi:hypothetical protein
MDNLLPGDQVDITGTVNQNGAYEVLETPGISEETKQAIAKFQETFKERTFSQRHPELGKMINCHVCGMRHRSAQVCEQKFAVGPVNPKRRYGMGSNKRINPHWNRKRLMIVDLTRQLLPYYSGDNAVQKAKSRAINLLTPIWREYDRKYRNMQKASREKNRAVR